MTDLEITKACAEAMGLTPETNWGVICQVRSDTGTLHYGNTMNYRTEDYDPLHDDAQAMALVKKFDIVVEREKDNSFGVTLFTNEGKGGKPIFVVRQQLNLNYAICECVAKMQQAKVPSHGYDFTEEMRKIMEAYCVLRKIACTRRYTDDELAVVMPQVRAAMAQPMYSQSDVDALSAFARDEQAEARDQRELR